MPKLTARVGELTAMPKLTVIVGKINCNSVFGTQLLKRQPRLASRVVVYQFSGSAPVFISKMVKLNPMAGKDTVH